MLAYGGCCLRSTLTAACELEAFSHNSKFAIVCEEYQEGGLGTTARVIVFHPISQAITAQRP